MFIYISTLTSLRNERQHRTKLLLLSDDYSLLSFQFLTFKIQADSMETILEIFRASEIKDQENWDV